MSHTLHETVLVVDSSSRDIETYPSSSEYTIPLGRHVGVCGVDILDADIPTTQYPISTRNDTLTFSVGTSALRSVTVTSGTYTAASLISALQSALTSDGSGLSVSLSSGHAVFSHASSEFTIWTNRPASMHKVLGFITTSPSVQSTARSLTPSGIVDPDAGPRYIRVRSTLSVDEHVVDPCEPGVGVYWLDSSHAQRWCRYPTRFYDRPKQVNSIGIRLENPDGTLYETGSVDHVFVVRLWKARASTSASRC